MITRLDMFEEFFLRSNNERTKSQHLQTVNGDIINPLPKIIEDSARSSGLLIDQDLEQRFQDALQSHPKSANISEIPLNDWAEAAVWWFDKV
jgi:hypothetical protein